MKLPLGRSRVASPSGSSPKMFVPARCAAERSPHYERSVQLRPIRLCPFTKEVAVAFAVAVAVAVLAVASLLAPQIAGCFLCHSVCIWY